MLLCLLLLVFLPRNEGLTLKPDTDGSEEEDDDGRTGGSGEAAEKVGGFGAARMMHKIARDRHQAMATGMMEGG